MEYCTSLAWSEDALGAGSIIDSHSKSFLREGWSAWIVYKAIVTLMQG